MERRIAPVVHKRNLHDPESDFAYWQQQPYEARIAALEEIRREYHARIDSQQKDASDVQSKFQEFIESLNDNQVRYLVVGSYAVALHGHPHYTKDLDIWVECSPENSGMLFKALAQFGMGSLGLTTKDFSEPDQVIQIGFPPDRIDILTSASGVKFAECYEHCTQVNINGIRINFINLEDLRKNKKASGRLQDLADLENLRN